MTLPEKERERENHKKVKINTEEKRRKKATKIEINPYQHAHTKISIKKGGKQQTLETRGNGSKKKKDETKTPFSCLRLPFLLLGVPSFDFLFFFVLFFVSCVPLVRHQVIGSKLVGWISGRLLVSSAFLFSATEEFRNLKTTESAE
mmetsp:Transcript_57771/g.65925  ORF Transcript_57771/g.65925 Transcript_57771/m.65925 type:complete len:146 (-) Transcript_57771:386-823(-)